MVGKSVRLHVGFCWMLLLSSSTVLAQATRQVLFTAAEGSDLAGLVVSYDDTVYGTLAGGGARNGGTLIRRTPDGRVGVLHDFGGAEGSQPLAAPIFGPKGELYGATATGGDHGYGTAYRVTASGELSVLHHFTLDDGGAVRVPLTLTSDGRMLGVTSGVYTVDCFPVFYDCHLAVQRTGKIFELQADGSTAVLYDGIINPGGALLEASDGNLYGARAMVSGMSPEGSGVFSQGSIYRLRPDGSVSFEGLNVPSFDPRGELIESIDGYLIGMSTGSVFRMTLGPDDTVPQISSVAAVDMAPGGLALGSDGKLYGGRDSFLRLGLDGQVARVRTFDDEFKPPSAAIRADSCATAFFVPSGNDLNHLRTNGTATSLHHFGFQAGRQLEPSSVIITRAGELYGTTSLGGAHENGTLFKVTGGGALSAVYDFPAGTQVPSKLRTPLVEAADGALYAVTYETTPKLVRVDPPLTEGGSTVLTILHVFDAPTGWPTPQPDSLVAGLDGLLYGTIEAPPNEYNQIRKLVYRFDPDTKQLQTFGAYDDVGPLLAATTGVYGTSGMAQNNGCNTYSYQLFRVTPAGERQVLYAFPTTPEGYIPISSLAEGPDRAIYGVANGRTDTVPRMLYRWTAAGQLENYADYSATSDPYEHGFNRHVTVGKNGEVYITRKYGFDANAPSAQTSVVLPDKTLLTLQLPLYLGVVEGPGRNIYRISPLERDGYAGFALVPIQLP